MTTMAGHLLKFSEAERVDTLAMDSKVDVVEQSKVLVEPRLSR